MKEVAETQNKFKRSKNKLLSFIDKNKSNRLFWAWIGYQAVKGTITTAFIWIPLIWIYLNN